MTIQIQNTAVDTAARPRAPIRVPTQNASTEANTVMSTFEATAGSASRRMTAPNESSTTLASRAAPASQTVAAPSCASNGNAAAGAVSDGRATISPALSRAVTEARVLQAPP